MPGPEGVHAGAPVIVGGASALGAVTTGGSQAEGPLVLSDHQTGPPVRTNWEAVQPPEGSDGGHYTHTQAQPQSVVTIEHGLGFRPAGVSLFSLDYGIEYSGFKVQHLNSNTVRVSMDQPTPCIVVLS